MAYSREIIKKVLQYVRFRVPQTEEKNSYYTEIGNTLVRISNHCTRLRVWDEILEKNPKWKGKPIISIVFEDDEDTFDEVDCLVLKRFRMKPIKVTEYVYRLQGDPQFITPQDERLIISGIKQVQGGKYTDLTNKCSEPILRVSQNPPSVPPNNQELNTEQYMDKKLIRLTESDLHRIVKESVDRVLSEGLGIDYHRKVADSDRIPNEFNKNQYMEILHLLDGIGALGWLIPSSDVHSGTFGQRQRITPEMRKAIELVISNKETLKDAAANAYKSFIDSCGENNISHLNKSITNGETIKDRYFPNGVDDGYREPEEKPWYFADEEY